MGKKLTIEYIIEQFEKEGYILLTTEYINNSQKLEYICVKGHKYNITWAHWQRGCRCLYCSECFRKDIEFIRLEFEKEGYKLLSKKYKNVRTMLEYICPNGHRHVTSWSNWQIGHRCLYCDGQAKLTIEFIKSEFEKEGYVLLTKIYENQYQKLEYICPKGHKHLIIWNNWKNGNRCPYCANRPPITIEFIRSEFEKERYKLLAKKYINAHQKLSYICPNGHEHSITWSNWQRGKRCLICYQIDNIGSNHPSWKNYSEEDLEKLSNYKSHVSQLTEQNYRKYKSSINPLNLPRSINKYHLDHIYSIIMGFENDVLPKIIAHPFNLRMLKSTDNLSKNGKSDISLDKLYDNYNKELN